MPKGDDSRRHGRLTRRAFIGSGAGAGAATLLGGTPGKADAAGTPTEMAVPAPTAAQLARDVGEALPPTEIGRAAKRPGSDLMVQVLKDLGIEFVAANPASSFEGLQESIVNYGEPPNTMPELITALHEESAVDMAQGYARSEGRPMAVMLHGTIGLQHASMAIYQAFHSMTPVVMIVGRDDGFFLQQQTANDIAGIARAYTKWDAHPHTLEQALLDLQQAYNEAITPPCGPTLVVIDAELQKEEAGDLDVPAHRPPSFPVIDRDDARAIARGLLDAENPRIQVGRLRTPEGVRLAVELAELVGASVRSDAATGPMSFPQRHPQSGPGTGTDYDFVLGLETDGADASINGPNVRVLASRDATGIGFGGVREPVLPQRTTPGRNDLIADAEASIPLIIGEARRARSEAASKSAGERIERHRAANRAARRAELEAALAARRTGWNGSPVSLARLYAELWPLIMDEDWCLSSPTVFSSRHHQVLWDHDRPWSHLGMHGAGGIGYCIGASAGAALAARSRDRIVINIQCDGDLNYAPGSLWTAVHHRLPLLTIMHNNRGYHQEVMYLHYMAGVRGRGTDRMHIGTTLRDPFIDYSKLAAAYGMDSEGPISVPDMLGPALERGVAAVKAGRPYLIDVITQPR